MRPVNKLRGEADVVIGGDKFRLVATMDGLARLSSAIGAPTFHEFYQRLAGGELSAAKMALMAFVKECESEGEDGRVEKISGQAAARRAHDLYSLVDVEAVGASLIVLMSKFMRDDPGDGDDDAGKEKAGASE